jgi:hypothetical protein
LQTAEGSERIFFIPLLDSLIQRFEHPGVNGGYDIHCGIQFFFGHSRFPCVRKAAIHSRIAKAHHRDGESDKHLFSFSETFDRMCFAVEGSKVRFLACHDPSFSDFALTLPSPTLWARVKTRIPNVEHRKPVMRASHP